MYNLLYTVEENKKKVRRSPQKKNESKTKEVFNSHSQTYILSRYT